MTTNKEEEKSSNGKISKASTSCTRTKDPRIVCVSRAFGGKDRHSKVCTVRGLKDRRVRLSVPTAIQLYNLQDRLGLNQPSKVVDWLLDAAKHEIDELPPLQMPQGNFIGQTSSNNGLINHPQLNKEGIKINSSIIWDNQMRIPRPNYWNSDANLRGGKSKEIEKESDEGNVAYNISSSSNLFSRNNQPLLNSTLPNNSFLRWDPSSNLSLSNFGGETENHHGFNVASLMPYFPSGSGDFDPSKQFNFQVLGSSSNSQNPQLSVNSVTPPIYNISQGMRPFELSINPNLFPRHNDSGSDPNKDT